MGLFFLSPLIAEYLLGNIAIDALWLGVFFAPLYGGGALLVRETARRTKRGWPAIFLLGLAYALIEEAWVTQSLFNPSYFDADLLTITRLPFLGMGAWWTLYVLTLHTVWSIAVPIALIEAMTRDRATEPWLGKFGFAAAAILFLSGAVLNFYTTYAQERFLASPAQLTGAGIFIFALIVLAIRRKNGFHSAINRPAPSPWLVGGVSFAGSSVFSLGLYFPSWFVVAIWLALFSGFTALLFHWSRQAGWSRVHELAVAGGALLTYAWQGFPHEPVLGSKGTIDWIGNSIFALGAVLLLAGAALRLAKTHSTNRQDTAAKETGNPTT